MADPPVTPNALVVAMPERHLEAAAAMPDPVVLPAGSPGDLEAAEPGWPVLLIPIETEGGAIAVRWRAEFLHRLAFQPGDPIPDRVPPTWVGERHRSPGADEADPGDRADPDEDVEPDEDDEGGGPQSFFAVTSLTRLPRSEWIFANELVPKQQRLGRTFLPRAPRAIRLRD
jgi:hypothetical protein